MWDLSVSSDSMRVVLSVTNSERCEWIIFRRVVWLVRMAEVSLDVGAEEWEEVVDDDEEVWWERGRGEVCVPMSRWKSSVGSSSSEESSSDRDGFVCGWWGLCAAGGSSDTMPSSFEFSLSRSACAVSASWWRAEAREVVMGVRMYLLRP